MIKTANLTGSVSRRAGGLFESVRHLVLALSALGMDVRVFSSADEFTAQDLAAWQSVVVKTFTAAWPEQFGYSPHYLKELIASAPDVTHVHGLWMYQSVAMNHYHRRSAAPYLISPHGMLDPWAIRNSKWKKTIAYFLFEGSHLRNARCLRALCISEARSMRQLGLKNPIAIIPNGIEIAGLRTTDHGPRTTDLGPWSLVPGFDAGRKVLLYLGRIHPKKGLLDLIRAWASVCGALRSVTATPHSTLRIPHSDEWILAIAGWDQGGHEDELKRLATELGVPWVDAREKSLVPGPWSLVFLGPQFNDTKAACYANCDAFILPSLSEGLPMVVLEAWAYGKPVVMTPECNLPEGFEAAAAIRIEANAKSIANGLRELLGASTSDLANLGQNGRNLVTQRFTWPKIAAGMKGVYEWMLGSGPKPDCLADF